MKEMYSSDPVCEEVEHWMTADHVLWRERRRKRSAMYLVSSRGERHLGLSHQNIAILGWVLRVVVLLSNRGHVFYSEKE